MHRLLEAHSRGLNDSGVRQKMMKREESSGNQSVDALKQLGQR
jgi:hypothetical protein